MPRPPAPLLRSASTARAAQLPSQLKQRFTTNTSFGAGTTLTNTGFDLLSRLLAWDPDKRMGAAEALAHP